jgi:nucleoside-diphosphate-sugar epimerase
VRVLVVGGTGFIGRPTVRRLVESGHEVTVFHRGKTLAQLPAGIQAVLGERERVREAGDRLRACRPDVVVDFIAFTAADVRGLLDALRGAAGRCVFLSSLDVYRAYDRLMRREQGPPGAIPIDEDAPLRETSFPRRSQASSPEDVMWSYDKIHVEREAFSDAELRATILRLPAVYGPGDRTRHRVGSYLRRMDAGGAAFDLDRALSRWRWTRGYVEDVASAIALAAVDPRASGRTYNVGESDPSTEGDWVRAIARLAGYAGPVIEKERPDLPADVARELDECDFTHDLVLDTRRIHAELGWRPRTPADEALAASIAWERTAT